MLPSELHFSVCAHSSVFLIFILCVSAIPRRIRERLWPDKGQTMDLGRVSCAVALLPSSSFGVSLCHYPPELAGDRRGQEGSQGLLGHSWTHGVWSPEERLTYLIQEERWKKFYVGTKWEKAGRIRGSESSPFHRRTAEARDVCHWCALPVAASGCGRRAAAAVCPSGTVPSSHFMGTRLLSRAVCGHFQAPEESSQWSGHVPTQEW